MKRLNRGKRLQAKLKLGKETLKIDVDALSVMRRFAGMHDTLAKAEKKAVRAYGGEFTAEKMDEVFEAYGTAIIDIMQLFFGVDNTEKILLYYENNYIEMSQFVLPYIHDTLVPLTRKILEQQRNALAKQFGA